MEHRSVTCWYCANGHRENSSEVWCNKCNSYCSRSGHCANFIRDPKKDYAPEEKTKI